MIEIQDGWLMYGETLVNIRDITYVEEVNNHPSGHVMYAYPLDGHSVKISYSPGMFEKLKLALMGR